jgi:hypothetical protein
MPNQIKRYMKTNKIYKHCMNNKLELKQTTVSHSGTNKKYPEKKDKGNDTLIGQVIIQKVRYQKEGHQEEMFIK